MWRVNGVSSFWFRAAGLKTTNGPRHAIVARGVLHADQYER